MVLYIIAKLFLACKLEVVCIYLIIRALPWDDCFYIHI